MSYFSFELLDQAKPIVVFGRDGQVGRALQVCLKYQKIPAVFLGREECDLANEDSIRKVLNYYQPQVIINAAAYTAVDKAETEPELTFATNARAPQVMAHYVANISHGIFLHYSTEYVFADTKQTAYLEMDMPGPIEQLSTYGQSKLAGEKAIKEAFDLAYDHSQSEYQDKFSRYYILRTSWVYGDGGNFIRTILRLAGECDHLKIVDDQIGAPTSAQWLAEVGIQMVGSIVESGIYHAVPDGETSWYGLAVFAIEVAALAGKRVEVKSGNIMSVSAADYPLPATRPHNSGLNNIKLKKALSGMAFSDQYPHWKKQVETYVKEYVTASLKS